jgi:hypothetical protein
MNVAGIVAGVTITYTAMVASVACMGGPGVVCAALIGMAGVGVILGFFI